MATFQVVEGVRMPKSTTEQRRQRLRRARRTHRKRDFEDMRRWFPERLNLVAEGGFLVCVSAELAYRQTAKPRLTPFRLDKAKGELLFHGIKR